MFLTYLDVQIQYDRVSAYQIMKGYFLECCSTDCSFLKVADKESQVFKKGFNVSLLFQVKIKL